MLEQPRAHEESQEVEGLQRSTSSRAIFPPAPVPGLLSDRNAKANLMAVDGYAILERLASLPIATWNYKSQSDSVRHMGPMAQFPDSPGAVRSRGSPPGVMVKDVSQRIFLVYINFSLFQKSS